MKYAKKLAIVFSLMLCTTLATCQMAYANESNILSVSEPPQEFIHDYSNLFQYPEVYSVMDHNGTDITDTFISTYEDAYTSHDFQTIWDAVAENNYKLSWPEMASIAPSAFLHLTPTQVFAELLDLSDLVNNKRVYMRYFLTGDYTVNDSSGYISGYNNPRFGGIECSPGDLFQVDATNIVTYTPTLNTEKTEIIFAASFNVHATYGEYYTGVTLKETDLGPFSARFKANTLGQYGPI